MSVDENVGVQDVAEVTIAPDYEVAALRFLAGYTGFDVVPMMKMAKGLIDDDTTAEQAMRMVIEMIKPKETAESKTEVSRTVPMGITLLQPDGAEQKEKEPRNLSEALFQKYKKKEKN